MRLRNPVLSVLAMVIVAVIVASTLSKKTEMNPTKVAETVPTIQSPRPPTPHTIGTARWKGYTLPEFGNFRLLVDDELESLFGGRERCHTLLSCVMFTLKHLHGSVRLRGDTIVYWDRELVLAQALHGVFAGVNGGVTLKKPVNGNPVITLFGTDARVMQMALGHELAHANMLAIPMPEIVNEGLAMLTHVMIEELWLRGVGAKFDRTVNDLWNGRCLGQRFVEFATMNPLQDGLEPVNGEIARENPRLANLQYALAGRTFFLLLCGNASLQPGRNIIAEFLQHMEGLGRSVTMTDCRAFFERQDVVVPAGEGARALSLFREPKRGLSIILMPPVAGSIQGGAVTVNDLLVLYRESGGAFPATEVVLQNADGYAEFPIPAYGGLVETKAAVGSGTWIKIYKKDEPSVSVTLGSGGG